MVGEFSTLLENAKLFSKVFVPIYIPVKNPYPYLLFFKFLSIWWVRGVTSGIHLHFSDNVTEIFFTLMAIKVSKSMKCLPNLLSIFQLDCLFLNS